jgi:hypothetical protein
MISSAASMRSTPPHALALLVASMVAGAALLEGCTQILDLPEYTLCGPMGAGGCGGAGGGAQDGGADANADQ